jgi:hypothetical protein
MVRAAPPVAAIGVGVAARAGAEGVTGGRVVVAVGLGSTPPTRTSARAMFSRPQP